MRSNLISVIDIVNVAGCYTSCKKRMTDTMKEQLTVMREDQQSKSQFNPNEDFIQRHSQNFDKLISRKKNLQQDVVELKSSRDKAEKKYMKLKKRNIKLKKRQVKLKKRQIMLEKMQIKRKKRQIKLEKMQIKIEKRQIKLEKRNIKLEKRQITLKKRHKKYGRPTIKCQNIVTNFMQVNSSLIKRPNK